MKQKARKKLGYSLVDIRGFIHTFYLILYNWYITILIISVCVRERVCMCTSTNGRT